MAKKKEEPSVNELSNMSAETEATFDEAFADGTAGEGSEKAGTSGVIEPEKVPEKELKEGEDGTGGKITPKEEHSDAGTSGEDFKHKYETLQGLYNKEKTEKETLKGKVDELASKMSEIENLQDGTKKQKAEAEKKKGKLAEALLDLYADLSPEEKAELAAYDDEFDVVSKQEGKKRALLVKKFEAYINEALETSNKTLLTQLAPFLMASEKATEELHFTSIKKAHQDFEKYRDDGSLKKWIDEQPTYLKKEFQRVYNEGEADEVIDLFSRFKKENNIGKSELTDDQKKKIEADTKKKQDLENMEVVDPGKRAIGSGGGVGKATDYDSAFDEAIKASR
jgi:hypothetical protein